MFNLILRRDFVAQHFLIGGDWGSENDWHSHHYRVELTLESSKLDAHGYLVDLDDLERCLDGVVERYRDKTLNELPEFAGLNPSVERFAQFFHQQVASELDVPHLEYLTVTMWEHSQAAASYRGPAGGTRA